jgi:2,4-dichlorophenol 6-monooxygenase
VRCAVTGRFRALNVEHGYRYQSAAVVPDGSAASVQVDDIREYQPSTRPGSPCGTPGSTTVAGKRAVAGW